MNILFALLALFLFGCSEANVVGRDPRKDAAEVTEDALSPEQARRAKTLLPAESFKGKKIRFDLEDGGIRALPPGQHVWDFRKDDTPVKDQGSNGFCTAFSTVAVMEHVYKTAKAGKEISLSEDDLWSFYQQYDSGAATQAAAANFVAWEADWPYQMSGFTPRVKKPAGHVHVAQWTTLDQGLSQIIDVLKSGTPVVFSFDVSQAFMATGSNGLVSEKQSRVVGGHAIEAVGVVEGDTLSAHGGGYIILKNSWNETNGDKGYYYLPYKYCARFQCYEAYAPVASSLETK